MPSNSAPTQKMRILRHLVGGGKLTSADAIYDFSIGRLAARIAELRSEGWIIRTDFVEFNMDGIAGRYASYSIDREQNAEKVQQYHALREALSNSVTVSPRSRSYAKG